VNKRTNGNAISGWLIISSAKARENKLTEPVFWITSNPTNTQGIIAYAKNSAKAPRIYTRTA